MTDTNTRHVVAWPLILLKSGGQGGGRQTVSYLRQGNPVPDGYDQDDFDRLVKDGAIVEVDALGNPVDKTAGSEPPKPAPAPQSRRNQQ